MRCNRCGKEIPKDKGTTAEVRRKHRATCKDTKI